MEKRTRLCLLTIVHITRPSASKQWVKVSQFYRTQVYIKVQHGSMENVATVFQQAYTNTLKYIVIRLILTLTC